MPPRAFFDLPVEEKNAIGETGQVMSGLMHFPLGKEALAATLGNEAIGDLKETLDFGPGFWGDGWPANPPDLEPAWRAYYRAMSELAATLRRIFAAAIGLEADYFEDKFQGHLSSLRVVDYPEQAAPPAPGQLRAGVHSDYGVLTILRTEDAPGGLQVCTRAGRWTDVPHIAGSFVVNIGDAMMRWTKDRWVSTPHRVVNPPGRPGPADATPVDRLLSQPAARHDDRVSAAISRGGRATEVSGDYIWRVRRTALPPGPRR